MRARVYDTSNQVEWVDSTMYDEEETVDQYDTAKNKDGLSTLNEPGDLEFLDMVKTLRLRSVLDLGCGAGAFYHLLSVSQPDVEYFGYDLSSAQVERATQRFGDRFAVRDISQIPRSEFAQYDAVHAYSVFSFMSVRDQIKTIRRVLKSGAKLLLETACTVPDVDYAPQSSFRHFGQMSDDGRELMTTVSFPYKSSLVRAVRWTGHNISFSERPHTPTRAINNSRRSGAALADKNAIKAEREDQHDCFRDKSKFLMARISPREWTPPREYDNSEYARLLCP